MIFVTVGAQMPFDRLVRAVDEWAGRHGRRDVFAQIGTTTYIPQHIEFVRSLDAAAYALKLNEADVVVAHAGMGTILSALERGKPLLLMPRRGDLNETRNDHQIATADRFGARGMVHIARDEVELASRLEELDQLPEPDRIGAQASPQLLEAIRDFCR